jgi:hypothetical protein
MNLVSTRETLAGALAQTRQKLQERDPNSASNLTREHAAGELVKALLGGDVTVEGMHDGRRVIEAIGREIWHANATAEQLLHIIDSDVLVLDHPYDPDREGYVSLTVDSAELRAWLEGRPRGLESKSNTPPRPKHPGGRPRELEWDKIHALTAWDLMVNGPPPRRTTGDVNLTAWRTRIQDACQRAGISEPSDASLRPWLTVLGEMRPFGAPED